MSKWKGLYRAAVVSVTLFVGSCATVPNEVVRLSSTLGDDIVATQTSYELLIADHFEHLRTQVNVFVDTRWRPAFLRRFIQSTKLTALVKDPDPNKVLDNVNDFAVVAIEQIDKRRSELLAPIDEDEKALKLSVDEAFNRMLRANTAVTAHLSSLRKVQEFQDQLLSAAGVAELRNKINEGLIKASTKTQEAINGVAKADKLITQIETIVN